MSRPAVINLLPNLSIVPTGIVSSIVIIISPGRP